MFITDNIESAEIKRKLIRQNSDVFREHSVVEIFSVISAWNSNRFVFKKECDPTTFDYVFTAVKLRIDWDICEAQQIVDFRRCFNYAMRLVIYQKYADQIVPILNVEKIITLPNATVSTALLQTVTWKLIFRPIMVYVLCSNHTKVFYYTIRCK